MKKACLILALVLLIIGFNQKISYAVTYTFQPTPSDLWGLDHRYYYEWGIDWPLPEAEIIIGATLLFDNIDNWDHSELNYLHVTLLDTSNAGVTENYDNDDMEDHFKGQGYWLGTYSDPGPGTEDIEFNIPASRFSWLSDGNFGFGIDPDCHYWNDGIYFTIETSVIPEPATLSLLGLGLLGLVGLRKRKRD